jgi:WD40 repeat protein
MYKAFVGIDDLGARLFFSHKNNFVASAKNGDRVVKVWSTPNGDLISRIELDNPITAVGFSPDGRHLAVGDLVGNVSVWDFVSAELRTTLVDHSGHKYGNEITGIAYSHDGKLLAASSTIEGVILWDMNAQGAKYLWGEHNGGKPFVTFSPDDSLVAVHAFRSIPYKWSEDIKNIEVPINLRSINNGEILASLAGAGHSIAFSADSDTVYTGGPDDTIRVWNVSSGLETNRLKLKTVENWQIISGVLGVIWFFFWLRTIRQYGFVASLEAPLLAVAITTVWVLFMCLVFFAFVFIFSLLG